MVYVHLKRKKTFSAVPAHKHGASEFALFLGKSDTIHTVGFADTEETGTILPARTLNQNQPYVTFVF